MYSTSHTVEAVAALRMHAVSGRNWVLVVSTLALGIVPLGTNLVGVHSSGAVGCGTYAN